MWSWSHRWSRPFPLWEGIGRGNAPSQSTPSRRLPGVLLDPGPRPTLQANLPLLPATLPDLLR
jgi:hypothetical protein